MTDEPRPFDAWDAGEHAYQALTHLPPEQRVKAAVLAVHSYTLSGPLGGPE